jgi:hypothetical protein
MSAATRAGTRRGAFARPRTVTATACSIVALGAGALSLASCGDTLQDQPIPHNDLETLLVAPYPVYWLGHSFRGLAITDTAHDPSGAFTVQYGNCVEGGQSSCVTPVRIVTSPDNSFVPGGEVAQHKASVRGAEVLVAQGGRTISIPTAGVVVGIYADSAHLAAAAADTAVPINEAAAPGSLLPARRPDTGFGSEPLPSQVPSPLRALR